MKLLKEICRGILIGVANIIPGVSGRDSGGFHGSLRQDHLCTHTYTQRV